MALKAGYYGIKKSLFSVIESLSGAKVIKTIGNGLNLSNAGSLSCDIDTETMEFKNGKLASKGASFDFSTTEFDTGQKWIDGKSICGIVITQESVTVPGGATYGEISLSSLNIDTPVMCYVSANNEIVFPWVTDSVNSTIGIKYTPSVLGFRKSSTGGSATLSNVKAILFYTKATV